MDHDKPGDRAPRYPNSKKPGAGKPSDASSPSRPRGKPGARPEARPEARPRTGERTAPANGAQARRAPFRGPTRDELRTRDDSPLTERPGRLASATAPSVPADAQALVATLMEIIEESAPLPPGKRGELRHDVLDLWRELTSERSDRQADYMGEPAKLAAYVRYFLPWNVVRLVPIIAGLDLGLKAGDRVLDIGSGPLTMPIALWIARPELRDLPLTIVCLDRVGRILETGQSIFDGLRMRSGGSMAWRVETRKAVFPHGVDEAERGSFALLSSANVFNESFWKEKGQLDERAGELAVKLSLPLAPGGAALVVEPGDPRTGSMLAALREAFILSGGSVPAPCPHGAACPMAGVFLSSAFRLEREREKARRDGVKAPQPEANALALVVTAKGRSKAPWCHFVLPADAAPAKLLAFSESVDLPKDRLVASYLYARPGTPPEPAQPAVRIVSDPFRLPDGGPGRYACSRRGYTLVRGPLAELPSGALGRLDGPLPPARGERDQKSGAVVIRPEAAPGYAPPAVSETAPARHHRRAATDTGPRKPGNPGHAARPAGRQFGGMGKKPRVKR